MSLKELPEVVPVVVELDRFVPDVGFIANNAAEGTFPIGDGCWSIFCRLISDWMYSAVSSVIICTSNCLKT